MSFTPRQIEVLRWLNENQSHRARWDGDHRFEISGKTRKIIISAEDVAALRDFWIGCPSPDKIYGLNDAGRAILAGHKG